MKKTNLTTENLATEIKTDLICLVQRNHAEYKAKQKLEKTRKKNNKILAILIATGFTVGVIIGYTCIPVGAKSPTKTTPTETTTTSEETTAVTADFECVVREVVGNAITVEYNDNLYSFYGDGYKAGQKVICTFTEDMKVTDASEPITEEPTTEMKFYNVPLSEELQLHIMTECKKYNITPSLVIALIERESNYNTNAIGDNGKSFGLMQIQPKWYQTKMEELGVTDLLNPYENTSVGINILADLFERHGGDLNFVLMAYNGGVPYAEEQIQNGNISDYALSIVARAEQLDNE